MRVVWLVVLIGLFTGSGCLDEDVPLPSAPVAAAPEPEETPQTQVLTADWTFQFGAGTPMVTANLLPVDSSSFRFMVPGNATRLSIGTNVTCASDPVCQMDMRARPGNGAGAGPYVSDGSDVVVEHPQPGEWTVYMFPAAEATVVWDASGTYQLSITTDGDARRDSDDRRERPDRGEQP